MSKLPAIRFIVTTVSSEVDRNGNSYHFARIRSTVTGKSLSVRGVGGKANARADVLRALAAGGPVEYGLVHCDEYELPKRDWNASCRNDSLWPLEHEVTAQMILALEKS